MRWLTITVLDALCAAAAIFITTMAVEAWFTSAAVVGFHKATAPSVATLLATTLGAYIGGLHEPSLIIERKHVVARATAIGLSAGLAGVFSSYALWFHPTGRVALVLTSVLAAGLIASWRLIYSHYLIRGPRVPILVLGTGETAIKFADLINGIRHTRFIAVGFVGDAPPTGHRHDVDIPYLGRADQTAELCEAHGIALVAVATNGSTSKWFRLLATLPLHGVRVTTTGALAMQVAKQIPLDIVNSQYLLDAFEQLDRPGTTQLKRVMDVTIAAFGLAIFAVLLPWLYIVVKLDSKGPFFFSQERVGTAGTPFRLFKIRTMQNAPNGEKERWAAVNDSRITRIGRLLRTLRIDEFPQFWNVIKGDMSIVGPRPEQPSIARTLEAKLPAFAYRTLVKPGITGWAQIHHGYAACIEDSATKLAYDLYYVRRYGLLLDVAVILRTVVVMLTRFGSR